MHLLCAIVNVTTALLKNKKNIDAKHHNTTRARFHIIAIFEIYVFEVSNQFWTKIKNWGAFFYVFS